MFTLPVVRADTPADRNVHRLVLIETEVKDTIKQLKAAVKRAENFLSAFEATDTDIETLDVAQCSNLAASAGRFASDTLRPITDAHDSLLAAVILAGGFEVVPMGSPVSPPRDC